MSVRCCPPSPPTCLRTLLESLGPLRSRVVGVAWPRLSSWGWHRMLGLSDDQADAWTHLDLAAEVQAMTDLPVSFAKDTTAATVAELVQGRGRDLKSFYAPVCRYLCRRRAGAAFAPAPGRERQCRCCGLAAVADGPGRHHRRSHASPAHQPGFAVGSGAAPARARLGPTAAYDQRALQNPWREHTGG